MCGICGVFSIEGGKAVSQDVLENMTQTLVHRGPDDVGNLVLNSVGFGFRRLSIIDLKTGNQPFTNEDQSVYLICNGEIFNYREHRDALIAKGYHFRSNSDVEVLLHLYTEYGEKLLDKVNGQFAFVLFDKPRNRLFIARDHFGVVPFFYTIVDGRFIFGSEVKAILAHPAVERKVDLVGLDQVLSLPGLVSPRTMFAGIHSLPPGHCMQVDSNGAKSRPYWDLIYPTTNEDIGERTESFYREQLEVRLLASVQRRLQADVPIGAYLSGGLDSSLITGMMQSMHSEAVRTFSITFGDQLINEREYQQHVVKRLGCQHHDYELSVDEIENRLRSVIRHSECPLKESYNTASMALSAATRAQGIPVVLSGEGADELFAGYLSYRFDAFRHQSGSAEQLEPKEVALRQRLWGDETIFYEKNLSQLEDTKRSLYSPLVREQYDEFDCSRHPVIDTQRLRGIHPIHKRSYLDMKLRVGDHLVGDHGDRMLLANSVEGRFPFLDVEVAQLATQIPPSLKLNGFNEKYILKQVARDYVPDTIIDREKYSFNAPGSPFLLREGSQWVEDMLSTETIRRQGYFDPGQVTALKNQYRKPDFRLSVPNEDDLLMIVLTFGVFLELFDMPALR